MKSNRLVFGRLEQLKMIKCLLDLLCWGFWIPFMVLLSHTSSLSTPLYNSFRLKCHEEMIKVLHCASLLVWSWVNMLFRYTFIHIYIYKRNCYHWNNREIWVIFNCMTDMSVIIHYQKAEANHNVCVDAYLLHNTDHFSDTHTAL